MNYKRKKRMKTPLTQCDNGDTFFIILLNTETDNEL